MKVKDRKENVYEVINTVGLGGYVRFVLKTKEGKFITMTIDEVTEVKAVKKAKVKK